MIQTTCDPFIIDRFGIAPNRTAMHLRDARQLRQAVLTLKRDLSCP